MLSRLDQLFSPNDINKDNHNVYNFRVLNHTIHTTNRGDMFKVVLSDNHSHVVAYFDKVASHKLQLEQYNETKTQHDVNTSLVALKHFKVMNSHSNKLILLVYQFDFIGQDDSIHNTIDFKQPTPQPKKLQIKISKPEKSIDQSIEQSMLSAKKVKQEYSMILDQSQIMSSFTKKAPTKQLTEISQLFKGIKDWTLVGRIIKKVGPLEYKRRNSTTTGEYFKIFILDNNQDIIVGIFYDKACNKFCNQLINLESYSFTNAQVSQSKYDGNKSLLFDEYSLIREVESEIPQNPTIKYQTIKEILDSEQGASVDLIAIVYDETQHEKRRTLTMFDQTGRIQLNLWSPEYDEMKISKSDILCFKGLKFSLYQNSGSLNTNSNATVFIENPTYPEIWRLRKLLSSKPINELIRPLDDAPTCTLQEVVKCIEDQIINNSTRIAIHKVFQASITQFDLSNLFYASCTSSKCLKKLQYNPIRQNYSCDKCHIETSVPKYRYILKATLADDSNSITATMFDDISTTLLGLTANEFHAMPVEQQHNSLLQLRFKERVFRISIAFMEYQGAIKPNITVNTIETLNYTKDTWDILAQLEEIDNLNQISQLM